MLKNIICKNETLSDHKDMRYLRLYEAYGIPQVGDWVLAKVDINDSDNVLYYHGVDVIEYINSHIGQVVDIIDDEENSDDIQFQLKYDKELGTFGAGEGKHYDPYVYKYEIMYWDRDRESVELKIQANKYNL